MKISLFRPIICAYVGEAVHERSRISIAQNKRTNSYHYFFISAMNECEIRGIRCPFGSECKNSARSAYDCVCAKGFKLLEEKQKPKKCEGRISFTEASYFLSRCALFLLFFRFFKVLLLSPS